ncbi:hypothetical protein [Rhodoferax sp.]|uniref:hypothetical protein n=1 Tax=Rhodoferax sp. TaxID=50421 RepID=UPI0025E2FDC7|nr:hypothetical protein [Rhodoferax sp.]MCM2295350.1 hypothetical protein [Rhodoferax sp.]
MHCDAIKRSVSLDEVLAKASVSPVLVMGPLSRRSWKLFHLSTTLDETVQDNHY